MAGHVGEGCIVGEYRMGCGGSGLLSARAGIKTLPLVHFIINLEARI